MQIFLSKPEQVSKSYGRVLKHRIRKKYEEFSKTELPLLQKTGISEFNNNITEEQKLRAGIEPATFTLPR